MFHIVCDCKHCEKYLRLNVVVIKFLDDKNAFLFSKATDSCLDK